MWHIINWLAMHRYWPNVKVALSPSWEVSLYSWLGIFMLWHHWSPIKLKTIQHGSVYKQKELFEAKLHHSVDSYVPLSLQNKPCGNITMSLDKFWSSLKVGYPKYISNNSRNIFKTYLLPDICIVNYTNVSLIMEYYKIRNLYNECV